MQIETQTVTLTVDTVRRRALPLGTEVLAGGERLDTPVRWATVITPDSVPYLEGGELLLVASGEANESTLTQLIETAQQADVAGIVIADEWPPALLGAAQLAELPVLRLPLDSHIREVEQAVISLILDRAQDADRRSAQIYQQLVQIAADAGGLDRLIHELSRLTDKAIVVQDKRLHVQYLAVPPRLAADWDRLADWLSQREAMPTQFQDRHRLPLRTTPTLIQSIPNMPLARLITPIVTQNVGRGYVSFVAAADEFTEIDSVVNRHAAALCALEMAHAKAINETEKRLRGDFLDGLLMRAGIAEAEAVAEGAQFGHEMNVPHVALVIALRDEPRDSNELPRLMRRLETVVNGFVARRPSAILARLKEREMRVVYANDSPSPVQAARKLADEIQAEAQHEYPGLRLAIGIGTVATRVSEWRDSYRKAQQAADLARRLKSDEALYSGDLGIYEFLTTDEYQDGLLALRDSTIGHLIQHEEKQRSELLLTLEAFFQAHGNHTQTADLLHIHRNTLSYRMNRIAEITGLDLNQPDVRLAVHLALKIHRLLGRGD